MNLKVDPSPFEYLDETQPWSTFDYSLVRETEAEDPTKAILGFLTHIRCEIINVYFKPPNLWEFVMQQ